MSHKSPLSLRQAITDRLTEGEAWAIWQVLSAFVENCEADNTTDDRNYLPAKAICERLDGAIATWSDGNGKDE